MKGEDISDRLETFAVRVLAVVKDLPKTAPGRHLAGQLLRSGTSPGANYEEARGAESRADFAHKLGIVLKELRESGYWLRLIARAELLPPARLADLLKEVDELSKIIAQSIITVRKQTAPKKEN
jgi:four helix bundle protein